MKRDEALKLIPAGGFIKVATENKVKLSSQDRITLIRKGNELYNRGEVEKAKRIFLTTNYTDGLIRIGQYYEKKNRHIEALQMYWIAPAPDRRDVLIETMSSIVRKWLKE